MTTTTGGSNARLNENFRNFLHSGRIATHSSSSESSDCWTALRDTAILIRQTFGQHANFGQVANKFMDLVDAFADMERQGQGTGSVDDIKGTGKGSADDAKGTGKGSADDTKGTGKDVKKSSTDDAGALDRGFGNFKNDDDLFSHTMALIQQASEKNATTDNMGKTAAIGDGKTPQRMTTTQAWGQFCADNRAWKLETLDNIMPSSAALANKSADSQAVNDGKDAAADSDSDPDDMPDLEDAEPGGLVANGDKYFAVDAQRTIANVQTPKAE